MTRRAPALAIVAVLLAASSAAAQVPATIPVEGVLHADDGTPREGPITMTLRIWDASAGGTMLFEETQTVTASRGSFVAWLGMTTPLDLALFAPDQSLHLGVSVDGAPELSPRFVLGVAPYAARALRAADTEALGGVTALELSAAVHRHAWSDLTGIPATFPAAPHGIAWSDLTGVPASFPPSTHGVDWSSLVGIPAAWLDGDGASTGDITAVAVGGGLSGGADSGEATLSIGMGAVTGPSFAPGAIGGDDLNPTAFTRRVSGTCAPPSLIGSIAADGTVTCVVGEPDACALAACTQGDGGVVTSCSPGLILTGIRVQDVSDGTDSDYVTGATYCNVTMVPVP